MSFECERCGQTMASQGGFDIHEMRCPGPAAAGAIPPPPGAASYYGGATAAPPPGSQPAWAPPAGTWGAGAGAPSSGGPSSGLHPFAVVGLILGLVLAIGVGSLFVLGTQKDDDSLLAVGEVPAADAGTGGAAGDPAAATTIPAVPAAPEGFRTVSRPGNRFSIAVPVAYSETPVDKADLEATVKMMKTENPKLGDAMDKYMGMENAELFAIDDATGENVSVQRIIVDGADDVNDIPVRSFVKEYEKIGATGVSHSRVTLPAGEAVRVVANLEIGSFGVTVVQHILVDDEVAWILTFTQGEAANGRPTPLATGDVIASSFRRI